MKKIAKMNELLNQALADNREKAYPEKTEE